MTPHLNQFMFTCLTCVFVVILLLKSILCVIRNVLNDSVVVVSG